MYFEDSIAEISNPKTPGRIVRFFRVGRRYVQSNCKVNTGGADLTLTWDRVSGDVYKRSIRYAKERGWTVETA